MNDRKKAKKLLKDPNNSVKVKMWTADGWGGIRKNIGFVDNWPLVEAVVKRWHEENPDSKNCFDCEKLHFSCVVVNQDDQIIFYVDGSNEQIKELMEYERS